jgi:GNAT superfamily N-acetyltransferase
MDAKLRVEPVSEEQIEALLPLIAAYQRFYAVERIDDERNRAFFARFIAPSEDGMLLGAWRDGELVGYACLYWHFTSLVPAETVLMNDLYVVEAARGQGVGRAGRSSRARPNTSNPSLALPLTGGVCFPAATDEVFADGYAQTVTFALLLARSDDIELDGATLHTVRDERGDHHSLMGRALQLLTDNVAKDFKVTLDLLVRVIGAVDWPSVRKGKRDTYLHLYEHFLEEYDPDLRQQSGSYYTPIEVVEQMVRLTDEVLTTRLGMQGFGDERVFTVDPAMGTGTFLQAVIDRAADQIADLHGPGMVRGLVTDLAKRLVGFELQTGPYAVAELRTTDILRKTGATPPPGGMRLYVTDTLDDPNAPIEQLASGLGAISDSRRQASIVKRDEPVTVVLGNPPYRERAEGEGGWVEMGSEGGRKRKKKGGHAILDDFRADGNSDRNLCAQERR